MNPEIEIRRLLDIMPASGRMSTKILSKPQQSKVIDAPFPLPWRRGDRPIYINFDWWQRLPEEQRDLLLLRTVCSLINITWFKWDFYQGLTLIGFTGLTAELLQGDAVGTIIGGAMTVIAANQVWRSHRSVQRELDADQSAIQVALRRGYREPDAASSLLSGIEAVAALEGRTVLSFTELIRTQQLKAIANLSPVGVPERIRNE